MDYARGLEKSVSDKVLTGVSGGIAEYMNIDPVLVRVGWVILTFATAGVAFVVYIVMAQVMPKEGSDSGGANRVVTENMEGMAEDAAELGRRMSERKERTRNWLALGLIIVGTVALLANLGVFSFVDWSVIWPISLIVVGGAFLYARSRN